MAPSWPSSPALAAAMRSGRSGSASAAVASRTSRLFAATAWGPQAKERPDDLVDGRIEPIRGHHVVHGARTSRPRRRRTTARSVKSSRARPGPIFRARTGRSRRAGCPAGPRRTRTELGRKPRQRRRTRRGRPPPIAGPFTRATTALGHRSSVSNACAIATASSRLRSWPSSRLVRIHPMSAPAENALPAPVSTTTRTSSSSETSSTAAASAQQARIERVPALGTGERQGRDGALACHRDVGHIRNTPNVVASSGTRDAASSPSAQHLPRVEGGRSPRRPRDGRSSGTGCPPPRSGRSSPARARDRRRPSSAPSPPARRPSPRCAFGHIHSCLGPYARPLIA